VAALGQRWDHVLRCAIPLGLAALLLTGCTDPVSSPRPSDSRGQASSTAPSSGAPVDCSTTATSEDEVRQAVLTVTPGSTVCVTGDGLGDADLVLAVSGTAERPVVLAGEGATPVRSVTVQADHVVVQGFAAVGGEGIVLDGTGLTVRGNEVRDAARDGISCEEVCRDVVVEDNTVVGTDGSGILVQGERIDVLHNSVSGSVRREASDADGIRFFGTDIRIIENTVFDIKDDGYPEGTEPHTDCFQTFDNSRPPTVNVLIAGNVCRNVDAQCLIATAEESGNTEEIGRSHGIEFTGNECEVEGSQAVLIRWLPDVVVRENSFDGPDLENAAVFADGSTGAEFFDNTVKDGVRPFDLDDGSREGFSSDQPG
jgi:hypothetical protein